MAITTLDGAIAGMQPMRQFAKAVTGTMVAGRPISTWGLGGNPGAGSYDTTLNGVTRDRTTAGAIDFTNPSSGNSYLASFLGSATIAGTLILCDRIWENGGYTITSTSAQNSTTPTFGSRDNAASSNGDGYLAGKLTGHDPITPAQIRILYRHAEQGALGDGYLVALTAVNSVGEWRVENLNPALRYDVVARREGYNDVITAGVQPLPM